MITIGICDDEKAYRDHLRKICGSYLDAQKQEFHFVEFTSGEEVLAYQGDKIHLLFLDIEMPGMDGLEVMKKVRSNELIWRIVFVTSHKELKWETIDLKTLAFMEKPIERIGVETCVKTVLRENKENIDISLKTVDGDYYLKLDQILFIQAQGNYVSVYSKKDEITGYDSIKILEAQVKGTTMLRTHKSYLANLQYVEKMSGVVLRMTNGYSVPVGRKYYQSVKEAYFSFIKKITIDRNK
ncbi:MAG: LytTR family DNA-binding domain-containing protein [Acetatifactor sp.]|nr:LytTR family DNA-binding domain-containing protein [Acetatifactor sp.]